MAVAVSVVVVTRDCRSRLGPLVESLDMQSWAASAFEVVLVDLSSTDGTAERLRQIVTHRPNMKLVELPEDVSGDSSAWLPLCSGDYVLKLRPDQLLFPQALERLHALAAQDDLDAVSARVSQRGATMSGLYTVDRTEVDPSSLTEALHGPAVLLRHSLVGATVGSDESIPRQPVRVGVLASYPALVQPDIDVSGAGGVRLRQDQPGCAWEGSLLRVDVSGVLNRAAPSAEDFVAARPLALVRHRDSGLSYLLDSGSPLSRDLDLDGWRWEMTVQLDVRTAALGAPLSPGVWELDIALIDSDAVVSPVTVAWTYCRPALLENTIVVPSPTPAETLQLDVGPTTWPLVTGDDPAGGTVTETAAGSLLVLPLPRVHVSGAAEVGGQISLDSLRLRAKIVTDGQGARLEGFVSGLFGAPMLSTQFGATSMKPSGLGLDISGTGQMKVVKAKPKPSPGNPKASAVRAGPVGVSPARKDQAREDPASNGAQGPVVDPAAATSRGKSAQGKVASNLLTTMRILGQVLVTASQPVADRVAKTTWAHRLHRKVADR